MLQSFSGWKSLEIMARTGKSNREIGFDSDSILAIGPILYCLGAVKDRKTCAVLIFCSGGTTVFSIVEAVVQKPDYYLLYSGTVQYDTSSY